MRLMVDAWLEYLRTLTKDEQGVHAGMSCVLDALVEAELLDEDQLDEG